MTVIRLKLSVNLVRRRLVQDAAIAHLEKRTKVSLMNEIVILLLLIVRWWTLEDNQLWPEFPLLIGTDLCFLTRKFSSLYKDRWFCFAIILTISLSLSFVKVDQPITDYRTEVSGIEPHHLLSDYAMDFEECRETVLGLIQDKIVVGHGLKNDFNALHMSHPWHQVRDTTKYEPFLKADPYHPLSLIPNKLKVLADDILGISVQTSIHDSVQDAQVAMLLYKSVQNQWEKTIAWKVEKTEKLGAIV
jgi:DNA polymerase III epsilon subunit-like protein